MTISKLTALTFPYDRRHDFYQEYYRIGMRTACKTKGIVYEEASGARAEGLLRKLRAVRHSHKIRGLLRQRWCASLLDGSAGLLSPKPLFAPSLAGVYEVESSAGERYRFCIDAQDAGSYDEALAESSELYLKSNYWPTRTYSAKVRPIANLNPLVAPELAYFRSLRNVAKTYDLFAFFRIWGGSDEMEGVEHNLALIERLAKIPCKKYLSAYLVAGDVASIGRRLEDQGIHWTTSPMSRRRLWELAAASRLNIVRNGMHECIPWRMTDILAMGGCPVVDYGPRTLWPDPLVEGTHFLSLQLEPDVPARQDTTERVMRWLDDASLSAKIGRETSAYFDRNCEPGAVGAAILAGVNAAIAMRTLDSGHSRP